MCDNHTQSQTYGCRSVEQHTRHIHVMGDILMPNDFRVLSVPNIFLALNAVFPLVAHIISAFPAITQCLEWLMTADDGDDAF